LARAWRSWVALWSGEEHPRTLAVVRVLLGVVILWDFLEIARLGLVVPLFGPVAAGGWSDAVTRSDVPWIYDLLPATEAVARAHHGVVVASALTFTLGLVSRTSALVLLLSWAQFSQILPASDRGIDTLCRDVLCVFVFARSGEWLGLDAWIRTGHPLGDDTPVARWPRRLLVLQLVAMYFLAGIQKTGIHWYPMGHLSALYFILQDPAIARYDFRWLAEQPWFFFTQVGTATTILFQDTYPLVLLFRWWRRHPDRGGRAARIARTLGLEWWWIGVGAFFHAALAATTELGIFPWAMLALYPSWIHPDELKSLLDKLRRPRPLVPA
jgi:hypothetical protein